MFAAALPLNLDDPLHFWGNGELPTQFRGEILGKSKSTCEWEIGQGQIWSQRRPTADPACSAVSESCGLEGPGTDSA